MVHQEGKRSGGQRQQDAQRQIELLPRAARA
jgi:hypothetical protein